MTLATVVEVARPAARGSLAGPADLGAVVALALLAAAVGVLLLAAVGRPVGDPIVRRLPAAAAAVAVVAAGLRIAEVQQLVGDLGLTLGTRRVIGAVAVALVALLLAAATSPRVGLRAGERTAAAAIVAPAVIAAAVVAGPRAGSVSALATTAALVLLAIVLVAGVAAVLRDRASGAALIASLLVVAVAAVAPAVVLAAAGGSHNEMLALGTGELYVTVAPAAPGPNEVHVYVFGDDGVLRPVEAGRVQVDGGVATSMTGAGVGHLLAFGLDLPDGQEWSVTFATDTPDGGTLTATTVIQNGGNDG